MKKDNMKTIVTFVSAFHLLQLQKDNLKTGTFSHKNIDPA